MKKFVSSEFPPHKRLGFSVEIDTQPVFLPLVTQLDLANDGKPAIIQNKVSRTTGSLDITCVVGVDRVRSISSTQTRQKELLRRLRQVTEQKIMNGIQDVFKDEKVIVYGRGAALLACANLLVPFNASDRSCIDSDPVLKDVFTEKQDSVDLEGHVNECVCLSSNVIPVDINFAVSTLHHAAVRKLLYQMVTKKYTSVSVGRELAMLVTRGSFVNYPSIRSLSVDRLVALFKLCVVHVVNGGVNFDIPVQYSALFSMYPITPRNIAAALAQTSLIGISMSERHLEHLIDVTLVPHSKHSIIERAGIRATVVKEVCALVMRLLRDSCYSDYDAGVDDYKTAMIYSLLTQNFMAPLVRSLGMDKTMLYTLLDLHSKNLIIPNEVDAVQMFDAISKQLSDMIIVYSRKALFVNSSLPSSPTRDTVMAQQKIPESMKFDIQGPPSWKTLLNPYYYFAEYVTKNLVVTNDVVAAAINTSNELSAFLATPSITKQISSHLERFLKNTSAIRRAAKSRIVHQISDETLERWVDMYADMRNNSVAQSVRPLKMVLDGSAWAHRPMFHGDFLLTSQARTFYLLQLLYEAYIANQNRLTQKHFVIPENSNVFYVTQRMFAYLTTVTLSAYVLSDYRGKPLNYIVVYRPVKNPQDASVVAGPFAVPTDGFVMYRFVATKPLVSDGIQLYTEYEGEYCFCVGHADIGWHQSNFARVEIHRDNVK